MVWFSRNDLRKLSMLCQSRKADAQAIFDSDSASDTEKSLAKWEIDRMAQLSAKLEDVANSKARRVEITF